MAYEYQPYPKWVVNKEGVRVIVQNKEEHEQVAPEEKPVETKSGKKAKAQDWA